LGAPLPSASYTLGAAINGRGIAVDGDGRVWVTGDTATDGLATAGAAQPNLSAGTDAFVAKLTADLSSLASFTYLGGGGDDVGRAVAVSPQGFGYVAGETASANFPTSPGAVQTALGGGGTTDGFVTRFTPTLTARMYSTYLGGDADDGARAVAVDRNNFAT